MADQSVITVRKFCGVDVDINDFYKTFPYNVEGKQNHPVYEMFSTPRIKAEFIEYCWIYIGGQNPDSNTFVNKETKATGTINTDVTDIAFDFRKRGYDTSKFPGIVDTSDIWQNGRTRNCAGRKVNEDWIPAARFKFTAENEKLAKISTGSKGNSKLHHKTQHLNDLNDYEEQGVAAVEAGLDRNESDLRTWFLEETDFSDDFDLTTDEGLLTKTVNVVMKRTAEEFALVNQDIDNEKFVQDYKIGSSHQGKISIYKAKDGTAGMKYFFDKILSTGGNPPPTILYTDAYSPEECGYMVTAFITKLKEMHKGPFTYVTNKADIGGLSIPVPEFDTDFILGIIPNLDRGFQPQLLKQGSLVDVNQYIKDSGYKPSPKKKARSIPTVTLNAAKVNKVLGAI